MLERLRRVVITTSPTLAQVLWFGLAPAVFAILLRELLNPALGDRAPYVTVFPALLVAALWGGRWAGLICLVLTGAATAWLFVPPRYSFLLKTDDLASLVAFVGSGGAIVLVSLILRRALRDLTLARERETLLVHELQHRVKNNLAIVQSLASQTARTSQRLEDFLPAFNERLMALARVHNLLLESHHRGVELRALAEASLAPYVDGDRRVLIEGGPACVSAESAVSVALALHELATNAVKYGALSDAHGRVRLSWTSRDPRHPDEALLEWTEHDGPRVAEPSRTGFGSRLLKLGVDSSSRGRVVFDLKPNGLTWRAPVRLLNA